MQSPLGSLPSMTNDESPLIPYDNRARRRIGVHINGTGIDISVVARQATRVDFCLIETSDLDGHFSEKRWRLRGPEQGIWHGHLDGVGAGARYAFRAYGPWDPDGGVYYNPYKLLLDPYARAFEGEIHHGPELYAHEVDDDFYPKRYPMTMSQLDSHASVPIGVITNEDAPTTTKPRVPWAESVIYELHVKGFTMNMLDLPASLRGTYAGLAHPTTIKYLSSLGITAIELLPVHAKTDETFLIERGLSNYWGYSTLSFFTPEPSYATRASREGGPEKIIDEFRQMVQALHEAGLEVIMDVVYNHTCEGGGNGRCFSWRGLDSLMYYRYTSTRPTNAIDETGTGGTVDASQPATMTMILDSLRYWSKYMDIDGFRFDLATTLGRFPTGFSTYHPLLLAIGSDDELGLDKIIAEPWDVGLNGWQTGNFPVPFAEWNDRFRDSTRCFWLSDAKSLSMGQGASGPNDLATRLSGSADLFYQSVETVRSPLASINYVTSHDGMTLSDLTTYDHKRNVSNLEENRDGTDNNLSWNHGIEGGAIPPHSEIEYALSIFADVQPSRERSQRNLLTTMIASAGVPMIVAGDEFQRTQYGNNNAYCQDNSISWVNWDLSPRQHRQIDTVRWLLSLRKQHPALRPDTFALGQPVVGDIIKDVTWLTKNNESLASNQWANQANRVFQMLRSGMAHNDNDLLVIFNGTLTADCAMVPYGHGLPWLLAYDTTWFSPNDGGISIPDDLDSLPPTLKKITPLTKISIEPLSMLVLFSERPPSPGDITSDTSIRVD